jgi:hypothetical protein
VIRWNPIAEDAAADCCDGFIATSTAALLAISAAATAGGSVAAAKMGSNAATKGAKLQTDAANHAADVQGKAAADALAFQKEQAARDQANAEVTRHANYDQWASRESRLGNTLGAMLGLGPRDIPAYVPMTAGATPSGAVPAATAGSSASGNPMDPAFIGQQVTNELGKYGIKPGPRGSGVGDVAYWVEQIQKGKGWEPYWQGRIQQGVHGTVGAPSATKPASASGSGYGPLSIGAYAGVPGAPSMPLTAALPMPTVPYRPGSLGDYFSVNG